MARNGALVPESKSKLESLKSEAASSLNVNLKQRGGFRWRRDGQAHDRLCAEQHEVTRPRPAALKTARTANGRAGVCAPVSVFGIRYGCPFSSTIVRSSCVSWRSGRRHSAS